MMKRCFIIGAGSHFGKIDPSPEDMVIAADGGYEIIQSLGIRCDLLVGDMDSISSRSENVEKLVFPTEKDETDTYLAYIEGTKRGYTNFVIYGGVGGRDDHTFANFSLLLTAIDDGNRVKIVGEQFDIFAINNEEISLDMPCGSTISVFAFGGDAKGVSISGCKYSLTDAHLSQKFPLGVSNTAVGAVSIKVTNGTLLIMTERKDG